MTRLLARGDESLALIFFKFKIRVLSLVINYRAVCSAHGVARIKACQTLYKFAAVMKTLRPSASKVRDHYIPKLSLALVFCKILDLRTRSDSADEKLTQIGYTDEFGVLQTPIPRPPNESFKCLVLFL